MAEFRNTGVLSSLMTVGVTEVTDPEFIEVLSVSSGMFHPTGSLFGLMLSYELLSVLNRTG